MSWKTPTAQIWLWDESHDSTILKWRLLPKTDNFHGQFWVKRHIFCHFVIWVDVTHPIRTQDFKAHGDHLDLRLRMLLPPLSPPLVLGSGHGGSFLHFTPSTVLTLAPRLAISNSSSSLSWHIGSSWNYQIV